MRTREARLTTPPCRGRKQWLQRSKGRVTSSLVPLHRWTHESWVRATTDVDSSESLSNLSHTTRGVCSIKVAIKMQSMRVGVQPGADLVPGLSIDRENKLTKGYFPVESSFGCPTIYPFPLDSCVQRCCVKLILGTHGGALRDIKVYKNKPLFGCASVYLEETISVFIKSLNTLELWCVDQRPLDIVRPAVVSATCRRASLDYASTVLLLRRIVSSA